MSIQHREDSIRDMKLERLGVTPPQDWNDVEQVRAAKKAVSYTHLTLPTT